MKMISHEEIQELFIGPRSGPHRSTNAQLMPSGCNRLLFMDDDEIVREVAVAILGSAGFRVSTTETGDETLEAFQKACDANDPFDAVLLDLNVPGSMNGKETARRLREMDPNVRTILVTGNTADPVFTDFASHGFCYAVAKPFTPAQLLRSVIARFVQTAPILGARPEL